MSVLLDFFTLQVVLKPGSVWGVCIAGTTVPIFRVSGVSACLVGCTCTQANWTCVVFKQYLYIEVSGVSAWIGVYVKILTGGVCVSVILYICTL